MLKRFLLFVVFLLFYNNKPVIAQKVYDLPAMIDYFALDAATVATIQSWDYGSDENSPVKWKETELQWDEALSVYFKSGTAEISINGAPVTFTIIMSGTKIVVNRVQLNLSKAASVPVFDLEKILNAGGMVTSYIKCDNMMPQSYGTLAYSLYIPKKKETWVAYSWQCLKGECSANINIYYEKEKVDKLPCY